MKADRIEARVDIALRKDIEALAAEEGRTVADMTRRLLVEAITTRNTQDSWGTTARKDSATT